MNKAKKSTSLADKIAGLLDTAPSFDPEDDTNVETTAKVVEFEDDEEENDDLSHSKYRKANVSLLEDQDSRYAGKKRSRKDFEDSDQEYEQKDVGSDEEIESEDEIGGEESDEASDESGDDEEDSEDEEGIDLEEYQQQHDANFKHLNQSDQTAQNKKAISVQHQLTMWESLLEMRIKLQKCLIAANKMPQQEKYREIKASGGKEFTSKINETKNILTGALSKLIDLQQIVISKYPDTKKLLKEPQKSLKEEKAGEESDDEIASDTEPEISSDEETKQPAKKRKIANCEHDISKLFATYKPYRNSTIQKWNEKTRIAAGKKSTAHAIINQIEHNLSDKQRLIKRTQLKRSDYQIIGHKEPEPVESETDNAEKDAQEYNTEIFDDDDFYHQLLRELIEVKSSDLTDPVQLGRQWIQLQNLRSKMKRKIDTRATKGRRIRYAVHSKLINFMAPITNEQWTEEAKNELFSSLFGKSK